MNTTTTTEKANYDDDEHGKTGCQHAHTQHSRCLMLFRWKKERERHINNSLRGEEACVTLKSCQHNRKRRTMKRTHFLR